MLLDSEGLHTNVLHELYIASLLADDFKILVATSARSSSNLVGDIRISRDFMEKDFCFWRKNSAKMFPRELFPQINVKWKSRIRN